VSVSEDAGRTPAEELVDAHVASRRALPRPPPWDVVGVVALGGAIGAVSRFGVELAWPTPRGGFPWATFSINVVGCALIGVLMVLLTDVWIDHRLIRPFAGTGILGGFTTFSTYAVDVQILVAGREAGTGLLYLIMTPVAALAAVWLTMALTRGAVRRVVR
jgi:fluoride exporter